MSESCKYKRVGAIARVPSQKGSLQYLHSVIGAVIICACVLCGQALAQTNLTVTVNGGTTYQKIDGFGFAEAFGTAYQLKGRPSTEQKQILDLLFNPTTGAGMTILRLWAPSNSYLTSYSNFLTIEPNQPVAGPSGTPTYLWDEQASCPANTVCGHGEGGQVWLAQQAQTYGVNQFDLTAWSAPPFMKTMPQDDVCCTLANGTNFPTDWREAYANYLVQYLRDYQSAGITITHLGAMNEPELTTSSNQSIMSMDPASAADFIARLGPVVSSVVRHN